MLKEIKGKRKLTCMGHKTVKNNQTHLIKNQVELLEIKIVELKIKIQWKRGTL